jgi:predicted transcriptional regulator
MIMEIDELMKWVLSVYRRVLVIKEIHGSKLIKASDIAEKTGRSLQNTSRALRELEEAGLIECLTPGKHTWKRFIPTNEGMQVFEKLKKVHPIYIR